jgi:hypothetical protein
MYSVQLVSMVSFSQAKQVLIKNMTSVDDRGQTKFLKYYFGNVSVDFKSMVTYSITHKY